VVSFYQIFLPEICMHFSPVLAHKIRKASIGAQLSTTDIVTTVRLKELVQFNNPQFNITEQARNTSVRVCLALAGRACVCSDRHRIPLGQKTILLSR
jgi:hypothetical protein